MILRLSHDYPRANMIYISHELGGSRMEQKSVWKNFLLLTVGGLLALHVNVTQAAEKTSGSDSQTTQTSSEECVLEVE